MGYEFQIAGIRLNESHFSLIRDFKREKNKPIEIKHSVEVEYKTNDKILQVMVSVSSDFENQPFRFAVAWEGVFTLKEMPLKEDLDRIANINCAAIIFPYVRETIADLTRRANIPPFNLPPFNFPAMYEEKHKIASGKTSKKPQKKGNC
ncbi:MAG: protein-export chaperone SecB [Thermodesulfobacteriota bacterium]